MIKLHSLIGCNRYSQIGVVMMAIRMARMFLLSVIFFFSLGHSVVYSTSHLADDLPFIYYYSETAQAFIVEKANGDDYRILIDYKLCSGCWIFGPGWSPSGDWFAWTVDWIPTTAIPLAEAAANVVSKSGEQYFIVSGDDERVRNLSWSPVSDYLFFEVYVGEFSIPTMYHIWDATNQRTSFTLERDTVGLIEAAWTPSGDLVTYSNPSSEEAIMRLYTPSGTLILARTIKPVTNSQSSLKCTPKWANHNQVAFLAPDDKLVVENLTASTGTTFDFPADYLLDVDWSSDGLFAFIYAASDCVHDPYGTKSTSLWKLSLVDETLEMVSEKVIFNPVRDKRLAQVSAWSPTDDYWGLMLDE